MRIVLFAASLALAAAPALAAETAATATAAQKQAKEELICKERVRVNSRFTKKTCLTQTQWDAMAETARSAFAEVQNRPMIDITRSN